MNIENKRIAFLGDGITEGKGLRVNELPYYEYIRGALKPRAIYNYGLYGTRIAKKRNASLDLLFTDLYFLFRARLMPKDLDVIFIFGGNNDFLTGDALIGAITDNTDYTLYGAYNNLINYFKKEASNTKIVLITPLAIKNEDKPNSLNLYLKDYVAAIIEIAKYHKLPIINTYQNTSINLASDNPKANMHRILGEYLIDEIKKI